MEEGSEGQQDIEMAILTALLKGELSEMAPSVLSVLASPGPTLGQETLPLQPPPTRKCVCWGWNPELTRLPRVIVV